VFLPIGLDETRVSRLPWVSIGLLVANVAVFALSATSSADDEAEARWVEVVGYWAQHPDLELPAEMDRRFGLGADDRGRIAAFAGEAGGAGRGDQAHLDQLCEALFQAHDATPTRRFGLVPERGAGQPGWLTHLFMHGGLAHLLGNMLIFFLVVGPFLEDVWGRPFFLAFYLAGGLVALGLGAYSIAAIAMRAMRPAELLRILRRPGSALLSRARLTRASAEVGASLSRSRNPPATAAASSRSRP